MRIERDGSFPCADGTVIERRVVGERFIGNIGNKFAVLPNPHAILGDDLTGNGGVEPPFGKNISKPLFPGLFRRRAACVPATRSA